MDEEKHLKWQEEMNNVKNIAEVIVGKQRNGPIGSFALRYDTSTTAFGNLDRIHG